MDASNKVARPSSPSGTINLHFGIPCTVYFGRRAAFHEQVLHLAGNQSFKQRRLQKHDKK
jgi:hypothetical protein